ncbi:hypothetical protein [Chryseobacterium foetidum]|uniref:hypothetical protein n=1 Tax=Chryseobacterium foetidum TaxID=2951057 RepID=UPI0021C5691E|nr:hypothetical protein [Chryseobacterium foetidum]
MILEFSRPLIAILLLCFIVAYKCLCRKELLINFILDFIVGAVIIFMAEVYFEDQMNYYLGQGSAIILVIDFFFFALLYVISTSVLYWKKSKNSGSIIPMVIFGLYIILFFSDSELSVGFGKSTLLSILIAFFPIYIFNYFRVLYWYFNPERK